MLSAHNAILYLINHSPEHAEKCGILLPLEKNAAACGATHELVNDLPGKITVDAENKKVIVVVNLPDDSTKTYTATYTWTTGKDHLPASIEHEPGTFFVRGQDPATWKDMKITIQQFPSYGKVDR